MPGLGAYHDDDAYLAAGARIGDRAAALGADVVACVAAPDDVEQLRPDAALVGMLRPLDDPEGMRRLARTGVMGIALEMVPRITRAQKMDALSAMATVAGRRAVLLGDGAELMM